MDVSIIICTANRADFLRDTLASLSTIRAPALTELLVVDNRSVDSTRLVVEEAARTFPFSVRYVYEPEEGKYAALNAGIRVARGDAIVATDDDVRFETDWLERALDGLSRYGCGFVGGRVHPLWGGPKPVWIDECNAIHAKVIAILDYGEGVREFGCGIGWPLGVNVAYRREVFERVGFFDNRLGRKWGTLRNQAQREWHLRARAAGVRGLYLPDMVVRHLVEPGRLHKQYFRRWMYWHGISRAILYQQCGFDIEQPELLSAPQTPGTPFAGIPSHLLFKAARSIRSMVWRIVKGDRREAFDYELWLCFFAGVARQRWADRKLTAAPRPAPAAPSVDRPPA